MDLRNLLDVGRLVIESRCRVRSTCFALVEFHRVAEDTPCVQVLAHRAASIGVLFRGSLASQALRVAALQFDLAVRHHWLLRDYSWLRCKAHVKIASR